MDKLKILLMNHGEKVVAGICAMFGFLALTSASWKADHRSPITIEQDVTQAKAQIEQNQWPEEDQTMFEQIPDVLELTSDENKELVQASKFTLIPFSQSPNRLKEKRTAPMVIAPEDAVADGIILRLAMPPTEDEEEGEASETAEAEGDGKDEELSEDEEAEALLARKFGLRTGIAGAAGAEGYPGGAGGSFPGAAAGGGGYPGGSPGGPGGLGGALGSGGGPGGGPGGMGAPGMGAPGAGAPGMGMGGGYESDDYGGSDLYGAYGTSLVSKKKNVRVNAGISVRLIVDLQKQRNIIRKALHLSGDYQAAQKYIQYIDLHVERRQKQDGPNPWSNEWEPVSSEDLGEILKDSFGIDKDIVSPAVTRSTITMPLPRRAAGTWLPEEASHPRLENFELSAEEKAMFDKWNQIVKERLDKEKADKPAEVEQKGFSSYAQSSVDMSSSMYDGGGSAYGSGYSGNDSSAFEGMYDDYEQQSGGKLTAEQKELLDTTRATADLRLLLVRFMDFTVERGYSYQYRVRVEMKNPNYRHPLDELEDPAIGTEPTLMSDWSEATQEVYVPVAHRLYLTDVEARPGTPEKVDITVYTDTTETGMPVMGDVKVLMGLPIAGRRNLEVVDLTTDVLEEREVAIGTDDILSAAEGFGRLSTSDHPDLKAMLDRLPRGTDPIADEICIVDSTGDVHLRSVGDKASSEKEDRSEFAGILKLYEAWKPKPVSDTNSFFGAGEGGGEAGYGSGGEGLGMSPGSSSGGGYYGGGGGEGEAGGSSRSSRRGSSRRGGR